VKRVTLEQLIECVDGDRELVTLLVTERVIEEHEGGFRIEEMDRVLASRTLVRELDVNIAGVDIILRLREELAEARQRIAQLEKKLKGG
jgi:hypothetical protein